MRIDEAKAAILHVLKDLKLADLCMGLEGKVNNTT